MLYKIHVTVSVMYSWRPTTGSVKPGSFKLARLLLPQCRTVGNCLEKLRPPESNAQVTNCSQVTKLVAPR